MREVVETQFSTIFNEVQVGKKSIRMSNGKIRKFKTVKGMKNFENIARAIKHGWVPPKRRSK